ncbi:hypothetical protein [Vreelandella aquamarina]|uniref:hypothetical protein n=1 Tax=Vreelandella aquamarina TaxID=77097 RepID=UPI001D178B61|nr:hypothetical protein [Halomonas axialensis]MCC4290637.1 hypothetical protein [Halomonas axialensis]
MNLLNLSVQPLIYIPMKPDSSTLPELIILTQREHQRLNNQVKRLQTYALTVEDLQKYRASWVNNLGFVDHLPMLLQAMDHLLDQVEQGKASEADYDEVIFQIGIYKKASWTFIRMFYGSLSPYVDRWLKVLPEYKYQFEQRYEAPKKLSVKEQADLIRAMVDAVPNRDDPYNLSKSRQGRALLKEAQRQEDSPSKEALPSATVGNVVDFQAFKKKR